MMINDNYVKKLTLVKNDNAKQVHAYSNNEISPIVKRSADTVTLSDAALAKINGEKSQEVALTYIKPKTAKSLIAANRTETEVVTVESKGSRFNDMMQAILDKRLGIDRDKLAELNAMIEEIAKNENLSAEEKQKAIEQIDKMKDDLIKESIEMKKVAKQSFHSNADDNSRNSV